MDTPEILLAVIDSLPVGVSVMDRQGKIVLWNRHAERLTGFLRQDALGRSVEDEFLNWVDLENNSLEGDTAPGAAALRNGKSTRTKASLRHRAGNRVLTSLWATPLRDATGAIIGVAESFEEAVAVGDWEQRQSKLAAYGCLDGTSGVMNHAMLQSQLREVLHTFFEHAVPFAILCIALDPLETIRKRYGVGAQAALVRLVGQTLEHCLRPSDAIGRWQENEFLAILHECTGQEAGVAGERLRKMAAGAKIDWWGDLLPITVSIGAAEGRRGDSAETLIERAEAGMQESQAQGGNRVTLEKGLVVRSED